MYIPYLRRTYVCGWAKEEAKSVIICDNDDGDEVYVCNSHKRDCSICKLGFEQHSENHAFN